MNVVVDANERMIPLPVAATILFVLASIAMRVMVKRQSAWVRESYIRGCYSMKWRGPSSFTVRRIPPVCDDALRHPIPSAWAGPDLTLGNWDKEWQP